MEDFKYIRKPPQILFDTTSLPWLSSAKKIYPRYFTDDLGLRYN